MSISHSSIHPAIAALDFNPLRTKLLASADHGRLAGSALVALAEHEYRRFLTLRLAHPGEVLVPTRLVDEFWHAHILDTQAYVRDCDRVFGRFVHHFPYFGIRGGDDAAQLASAFERTQELYVSTLGEPPASPSAARCGDDHVCHAPSECACRCPEACK